MAVSRPTARRSRPLALGLLLAGLPLAAAEPTAAPATAAAPAFDFAALDKAFDADLTAGRAPGGVVAVVSGDKIVWQKAFGVASLETQEPVKPGMLFQIGSVTKTMTAAALLSLAAEGAVELNAPIGKYLPGLAPKLAALTLHQLLSQTSGLTDVAAEGGPPDDNALAAAATHEWTDELRALPPGRSFSYSNPGYALAGRVLEKMTGAPFADVMIDRIFSPLGLGHSTLRSTMALTYPHAVGHTTDATGKLRVARPASDDGRFRPAGSATWSNAEDLARFATTLVNEGRLDGNVLLPTAIVAQMETPRADIPTLFTEGRYGYGLFQMRDHGLTVYEHPGTAGGFSALIRLVPERHFALVAVANVDGLRFTRAVEAAMDLLAPAPPPAPPREALTVPFEERVRYIGTYRNRFAIEIAINKEEQLVLRRFGIELVMTKVGDGLFSLKGPDGQPQPGLLVLHMGSDGRADSVQMFLWTFPRVAPLASVRP